MKKRLTALLLMLCLLISAFAHAEESAETDWYTDTAKELAADLHELISLDRFAEYFTANDAVHERISAWSDAMEQGAVSIHGYGMPDAGLLMSMAEITGALPDVLAEYIERRMGSTLVSMINGSYGGVEFLSASSMAVVTEGYLMPEDFTPCIVLFEYDGICVSVSFSRIGEGVILGTAQFVTPEIKELLTLSDRGGTEIHE